MTAAPHLLIVDDDRELCALLSKFLGRHGYRVSVAHHGGEMAAIMEASRVNLVILDLMLPGSDGLALCRQLRATTTLPIIMLTAMADEVDRIIGLEMGADDYLAKPFSPRELVLRVQSVLRRTVAEPARGGSVEAGAFALDLAAHEVRMNGTPLVLTAREFDLLAHLIGRPHRALSREELLKSVWGWDFGDMSTVTVHVRRLREKIETDPTRPRLLKTVWGVGYRFDPEPLDTGALQ